jgi:hypothetical protein
MSADKNRSSRWHCQQICQQKLGERVIAGLLELEWIALVSEQFTSENTPDLRLLGWLSKPAGEELTTQAQRPGAGEATIATATLPPGSLQRMVRPHGPS